jgi:hypothetical protein
MRERDDRGWTTKKIVSGYQADITKEKESKKEGEDKFVVPITASLYDTIL